MVSSMASEPKPLVLSRSPGESIIIGDDWRIVTVLKIFTDRPATTVEVTQGSGRRTLDLRLYDEHSLGLFVRITLVGLRGERARLQVSAPPHLGVHRLEIYRAANGLDVAGGR
jgi:sRNA-binding carbon storage regulator CsrA